MCELVSATLATLFAGGGAATAAGATAGAATAAAGFGSTLATFGTLASIGGTLLQGRATASAARAQANQIEVQRQEEQRLNAIQDQRVRAEFASQIRDQAAQIGARGFSLDSPTAVFLGQTAAKELAFQSQSVRQAGQATQRELTGTQQALRARARSSVLTGAFSAAGQALTAAPKLFPEFT
ncbi:hypothetical protein KZZ08_00520 [Roseovarius mucosus]|uniref:hypothetical protein n=1 Tax=Roseovarius mucosus TaxID=215743 RepID=UPI001C5D2F9B|nr:hypothetical protein [Roseovarius mucosus]MBW4972079.1 hypothetical protein [Roseovarius mucosus]